jgi:hypothetical protein
MYVRVRGSSRVRQGDCVGLLLGPCAYPERKCALCVVAIQADGPIVDVARTLVTGRKRQGVCRARQHDLGDAVLVYVDYSELCIAGLVSIPTALFVDCLQGGGICP